MDIGFPIRLLAAAMLTGAALMPVGAIADSGRDYDRALRAVEQGEALPLAEILERFRPELLGGEIAGVEFERKHGRWVYELKVIDRSGRLWEFYVDAASAELLKKEGH